MSIIKHTKKQVHESGNNITTEANYNKHQFWPYQRFYGKHTSKLNKYSQPEKKSQKPTELTNPKKTKST